MSYSLLLTTATQSSQSTLIFFFLLGSVFHFTASTAQDNFDPGHISCKEVLQGPAQSQRMQVATVGVGCGQLLEQGAVLLQKGPSLAFLLSMQVNCCLTFLGCLHQCRLCGVSHFSSQPHGASSASYFHA